MAAEAARDAAQGIVGGDFATKAEAQGYANTAESKANSYTDQKVASIPTPDVSGQIGTHNTDDSAHADIRQSVADAKAYTDQKIAAIPTPDVSGQINAHNTNAEAHAGVLAPMYSYGTTDLTAGSSPLESGKLYFVYE